jgi:hypothetical protein
VAGVVALGAVAAVIVFLVMNNKGSTQPKDDGAGQAEGGGARGPVRKIGKFNEPAVRPQSLNNLKQIALGMLLYADAHGGRLPPAVVYDKTGKPLYSWRVLLLPYVNEQPLYSQFHLNEAWDSPHNKTVLAHMPRAYAPPGSNGTDTHYQVFNGPQAAFNSSPQSGALRPFATGPGTAGKTFEAGMPPRFPLGFTDGTSNTILVAEADEAVPWTKPGDLAFDPKGPLPAVGGLYESGNFLFTMADGSPHFVNRRTLSDATLRALITANAGDIPGRDWEP